MSKTITKVESSYAFCARERRYLVGTIHRLTQSLWFAAIVIQSILLASSVAFAVAPECEVPPGVVKLSKCIANDSRVVIGGATGTGECNRAGVTAYVDLASISVGKITINAGSSLKVFDRTAQLPPAQAAAQLDVGAVPRPQS
jgi:hypothetical protein